MPKPAKKTPRKRQEKLGEMEALLASNAVDQIAEYTHRGRKYQGVSEADLHRLWQSIWRAMANQPGNLSNQSVQTDLVSEYSLRGLTPHWASVNKQVRQYLKGSKRTLEKLWLENPQAKIDANQRLEAELTTFKARARKGRSN